MQRSSPIIFCLRLGVSLLFMPLSYSASPTQHYKKLHYEEQHYEKLNEHNLYYSNYEICILYAAAMQAYPQYKAPNPVVDKTGRIIAPEDALAELKTQLLLSPTIGLLLTSGYLHENLPEDDNKDFCRLLSPIILGFVQHEYYHKKVKEQILCWAVFGRKWDFVTEWLEGEMQLSRWHKGDEYYNAFIDFFRDYNWHLYIYKNNFLKKDLLSWLTRDRGWYVPTNQEISLFSSGSDPRKCKVIAYKINMIRLLKQGNPLMYELHALYIFNKLRSGGKMSSTALDELQESILNQSSYLSRLVAAALPPAYWQQLDDEAFIDRGTVSVVIKLLSTGLFMLLESGPILFLMTNAILLLLTKTIFTAHNTA